MEDDIIVIVAVMEVGSAMEGAPDLAKADSTRARSDSMTLVLQALPFVNQDTPHFSALVTQLFDSRADLSRADLPRYHFLAML